LLSEQLNELCGYFDIVGCLFELDISACANTHICCHLLSPIKNRHGTVQNRLAQPAARVKHFTCDPEFCCQRRHFKREKCLNPFLGRDETDRWSNFWKLISYLFKKTRITPTIYDV